MPEKIMEELLENLLTHRISPEEARALVALMDQPDSREKLENLLEVHFNGDKYEIPPDLERQQQVRQLLLEKITGRPAAPTSQPTPASQPFPMPPASRRGRILRITRLAAAAILLFAIAGTAYLWVNKKKSSPTALSQAQRFKNDVPPGANKALLKLSNGATIVLDDVADGSLAIDGNAHVIKKDGAVLYDAGATTPKGGALVYNDISTPAAGQYRLTLPDGTKVWLDASSGIHFPTSFPPDSREVVIRGQAYFEVAKNASKPFRVRVKNERVEVLGTDFNINAYEDEQLIRTTLAEGSIKVVSQAQSLVLQPGQQAQTNAQGEGLKLVPDPDLQGTLAWKDGLFSYNGADIRTIMRQVARWYGVNIVYQDNIREDFVAEIPREVSLSRLLTLLEATRQVHFKIEGKTITVMK